MSSWLKINWILEEEIMKNRFVTILLLFSGFITICLAHGTSCKVFKDSTLIIKAEYDDGTVMSYAEVLIFSPDDKNIEYQNGRTDRNGIFAFVPDKPGNWRIKVDDGMGHGIVKEITVNTRMLINPVTSGSSVKNDYIAAVAVIIGITGFLFYLKSRKR
jgi:nickel transport protein